MTGLVTDLRSAYRQFLRNRGLTMVALTSLALGIGMSVAITSVATAVLVRPLPYDRPEDVVMVWRADVGPNPSAGFRDPRTVSRGIFTPAMILPWRDQALPFADYAVVHSWERSWSPRIDLLDGAGVDRLRGTFATANVFDVLGVKPAIGRTFAGDEDDVAVISDGLWRRRFGADPGVVGKTITVMAGRSQTRERRVLQIIGVLPERVRFTYPEETEIWLALSWSTIAGELPIGALYRVIARLRHDTPIALAQAAMQTLRGPISEDPRLSESKIWLEPAHESAVGPSRAALVLVSALTILVLIGGAINAATAFAASTVSRLREVGVRRALGASQARLARQAFTEAAMLAGFAGVMGLAAVSLAFPALRAMLPAGLPGIEAVRLDGVALAAVGGAVAFSTLVAGLVPAWLSVRHRPHARLEDARAATTSLAGLRLRMGLLGVQFMLVSMLLVKDIRARSLAERPMPALYWPRALLTSSQIWVLVRTGMSAPQVAADVRRIVREVYPGQPVQRFATLQQVLDDSVADRRAYAVIASALACAILLLSGLGLCGHLSHVVVERARDLAIRSALGASTRQQVHLLVRHVVPPLVVGVGVAIAAVYGVWPWLAPFLFEIGRFDAISSAATVLLVTGFTAAAVLLPARRLSRLDPAAILQSV